MSDKAISGTDSRKNDRLLPCPFCGGEAEIHPSSDWDAHLTGATYFAWCDKCETRGNYYSTEKEAAKAWNTRAERTCRVEHVATNDYGYATAADDYTFDLSCGHSVTWDWQPDYCPWCGARVVE